MYSKKEIKNIVKWTMVNYWADKYHGYLLKLYEPNGLPPF